MKEELVNLKINEQILKQNIYIYITIAINFFLRCAQTPFNELYLCSLVSHMHILNQDSLTGQEENKHTHKQTSLV